MEMKFFKCKKCGKIMAQIKGSACPTVCCSEDMVEIKAGTTDAAVEKHIPVVTINGSLAEVKVGSVTHPMEEKHYIEWIALQTNSGCQMKTLQPGVEPKAVFALADGEKIEKAYAYCNLHSLWAADVN